MDASKYNTLDIERIAIEIAIYNISFGMYSPVGWCMGVPGRVDPHLYNATKYVLKKSTGLCPYCEKIYLKELDRLTNTY